MGFWSRLRGATALSAPSREAPQAAGGNADIRTFDSLDDPELIAFLTEGRRTAAGLTVGERLALRDSTLNRAATLISSSVGMLPLHLMERVDDGEAVKARTHPLFKVLHKRPNSYQTPFEFKSFMQFAALMDGNAYALIIRGFRGITDLIPLRRGSVVPRLTDDFELVFRYTRPSGGVVDLAASEVFHFRHPVSRDGIKGISLLDVAADALGLATAAQTAAARIFKNGTMVGGALETDKKLGKEAIEALKASMEERYAGSDNAGRWMVLEEGLKVKEISGNADDNQLLETRSHQAEEISRFTGVPRPLLMFDETSWGSGIEQLGLFFVTYCLMPWFVAWEEAIWRSCLTDAEQDRYFVKFNEGALLRGSLEAQANFFAKSLGSGGSQAWNTPDEVRANFNQNKIVGGDKLPERTASKAEPAKKEDA